MKNSMVHSVCRRSTGIKTSPTLDKFVTLCLHFDVETALILLGESMINCLLPADTTILSLTVTRRDNLTQDAGPF
jgi:hypothetical protein